MKDTKQIAILCFLADVGVSVWSYFKLTNYDEFMKSVKPYIGSPDFQVQIYQIMLQSFTFTLFLFLAFHLVIYYLFYKEKNYATKYVRFYTIMAALSAAIMIVSGTFVAIVPLIIYTLSYVNVSKMIKLRSAEPKKA